MADRKKVIDGLELCLKGLSEICPYKDSDAPGGCRDELMYDALVLLEAQEPVEPTKDENSTFWYWRCGRCGVPITIGDKFCRICGRGVKWHDKQ